MTAGAGAADHLRARARAADIARFDRALWRLVAARARLAAEPCGSAELAVLAAGIEHGLDAITAPERFQVPPAA